MLYKSVERETNKGVNEMETKVASIERIHELEKKIGELYIQMEVAQLHDDTRHFNEAKKERTKCISELNGIFAGDR